MNQFYSILLLLLIYCTLFIHNFSFATPFRPIPISTNNECFEHISVAEGLSQSTVYSIIQDKQGFMWFGTRSGGLNRYDGYEFKVFKNDISDSTTLSNNEITALFEDHRGVLWVGTRKGGLNRYDENTERFQRIVSWLHDEKLLNQTIHTIYEDRNQQLWVGTNSGLFKLTDGTLTIVEIPGVYGHPVYSICETQDETLCFVVPSGVHFFNPGTQSDHFIRYVEDEKVEEEGKSLLNLFIDSKNNIWLGSTEGIYQLQNAEIVPWVPESPSGTMDFRYEIRDIIEDSLGNIWFGSILGLIRYSSEYHTIDYFKKDENNELSLSHNSVYSLFEDRSGIIWIGTWGGGVNMYSEKLYRFKHVKHRSSDPESLTNNFVSSFAENRRGIWIGTELGGLNLLPYNSNSFTSFRHNQEDHQSISSDHIKVLMTTGSNQLWIGTYSGGLNVMNTDNFTCKHLLPNSKVFALAEYPKGFIWVGTYNGLYRLNTKNNSMRCYRHDKSDPNSLNHNFVNVLFVSSSGDLWIGTKEGGLMRYVTENDNFERFVFDIKDSSSISSDYIITFGEDRFGNVLIGTSSGLNMFNTIDQNFKRIDLGPIPDQNINGIISDESDHLWISTNYGIAKYRTDGTTVLYDMNDGLQSNEFNRNASFIDQNGEIYFGGINGYNAFHPSQIPINTEIPEIRFVDFRISNQRIIPGDEKSPITKNISNTQSMTLKYDQADFSLEFVSLNYIVPEKNQYAFMLEGYNDDWIYSGKQRVANYTNLKPGNYVFKVKGSNNDNVWNNVGSEIQIEIQSPLWKTPLAYIGYFLLICILLLLLRHFLISQIEHDNMLKNERAEKLRNEELNQTKLRFFTNVAHEFRTPLTLISGPLQQIQDFDIQKEEQKRLIQVVQNNVNRLLNLVNELMEFRKAGAQKISLSVARILLVDFVENSISCFQEEARVKQIDFTLKADLPPNFSGVLDQGIIDKVLFNLLSNAFKHTPKGGSIRVYLEHNEGQIQIEVSDSGIGIPEDDLAHVFERFFQVDNHTSSLSGSGIGLAYSKRLIEAHKGFIQVESKVDVGTRFTFSFPITESAYQLNEYRQEKEFIINTREINGPQVTLADIHEREQSLDEKILIVEDHSELSDFLAQQFGRFKVLTASNGVEGFHLATTKTPDIIISDVMMPEMNGLDMCRKLKHQFLTSHIPVVLLTARSEVEHKVEGLEHGADAYVEKPFNNQVLQATINGLIERQKRMKRRFSEHHFTEDKITNPYDQKFIEDVQKSIQRNLTNPNFTVEQLAQHLGMSRSQLFRKFKALFEFSPNETLRYERLKLSKKLMAEGCYNVNEVSDRSGFNSTSYFITTFKKQYGTTPLDYMKTLVD